MAVSREKLSPWRDHLHITRMMGVGPIKLSAFWEGNLKTAVLGLLAQVCSTCGWPKTGSPEASLLTAYLTLVPLPEPRAVFAPASVN